MSARNGMRSGKVQAGLLLGAGEGGEVPGVVSREWIARKIRDTRRQGGGVGRGWHKRCGWMESGGSSGYAYSAVDRQTVSRYDE